MLQYNEKIERASQEFVDAIIEAKNTAKTEKDYWRDPGVNKTYEKLHKLIDSIFNKNDILFSHDLWDLCGRFGDEYYNNNETMWPDTKTPPISDADLASSFAPNLLKMLEILQVFQWHGMAHLSNDFCNFPIVTDFKLFSLINPSKESIDQKDIFKYIGSQIWKEKPENDFSIFIHKIEWFYKKYAVSIFTPLIIYELKRGSESGNIDYAKKLLDEYSSLIRFASIGCELNYAHSFSHPNASIKPDTVELVNPRISIINKNNEHLVYETTDTKFINRDSVKYLKFEKFMTLWQEKLLPYLNISQNPKLNNNKVFMSLSNAIKLISTIPLSISHNEGLLKSTIALETILNPFSQMGDIQERLSVFAAKLISDDYDNKRKIYELAKLMFKRRNYAAHRSVLLKKEFYKNPFASPVEESGFEYEMYGGEPLEKCALQLFFKCYDKMLKWANDAISNNQELDKNSYDNFYNKIILK
jgi:hypothetical protein